MNREIKFRVYDSLHKDMSEPFNLGEDFRFLRADYEYHTVPQYCIHHDQFTPMQFTGLQDKNGIDVYESDIARVFRSGMKSDICEIAYIGGSFVMRQNADDTELDCVWFYEFEVIGNIHQNPELLEGSMDNWLRNRTAENLRK